MALFELFATGSVIFFAAPLSYKGNGSSSSLLKGTQENISYQIIIIMYFVKVSF